MGGYYPMGRFRPLGVRLETIEVPVLLNVGIGVADALRLKFFGGINLAFYATAEYYQGSDLPQPSVEGVGTVSEIPLGWGEDLENELNYTNAGYLAGMGTELYFGPFFVGVDGAIGGNFDTYVPEAATSFAPAPGLLTAIGGSMVVRATAGIRF